MKLGHQDGARQWVLDGEAEFELDGRLSRAGAGSFVLVPGGVAHTFGATASAPAHVLVLHAPALDDYFRELDELWSGGATPSREDELRLIGMIQPARPLDDPARDRAEVAWSLKLLARELAVPVVALFPPAATQAG